MAIAEAQDPEILERRGWQYMRPIEIVESVLTDWIRQCFEQGLPVADTRIKGAAIVVLQVIDELYHHDIDRSFSFSNRWLCNFKEVANLKQYMGHGESGDLDLSKFEMPLNSIQEQLATVNTNDIYNCDETGLYLRALSSKIITTGPILGRKIASFARSRCLKKC
ncbi:hypothetical protein BGZ51_004425 [Haplosporangium sp. Z 767]|nr:hypothetical protein BGZ50_001776 [Haplosporangium sp. Z 11]KAF9192970.1 hypothetical protein BGZ51_004425 [Haplosporangium sp. Z 767]